MGDPGKIDQNEMEAFREQILIDIETRRTQLADPDREIQMSINEWVAQLQAFAVAAHEASRSGAVVEELDCWLDLGATILGRIEVIRGFNKSTVTLIEDPHLADEVDLE